MAAGNDAGHGRGPRSERTVFERSVDVPFLRFLPPPPCETFDFPAKRVTFGYRGQRLRFSSGEGGAIKRSKSLVAETLQSTSRNHCYLLRKLLLPERFKGIAAVYREKREETASEEHLWERLGGGAGPGERVRSKSPFLGMRGGSWRGLSSPPKLLLCRPQSDFSSPSWADPRGDPPGREGRTHRTSRLVPPLAPASRQRCCPVLGRGTLLLQDPAQSRGPRPPGQAQGSARSSARPRAWARAAPGAFLLPQECP